MKIPFEDNAFLNSVIDVINDVERQEREIFTGVVDELWRSLAIGSVITGSPGQPEDTGELRDSFKRNYDSRDKAAVYTDLWWAKFIEAGGTPGNNTRKRARRFKRTGRKRGGRQRREFTLRSSRGGFHSLKLTIAAYAKVVDLKTQESHGR